MGVGGKGKYHVRCPICHGSCSISHSEINQDTFRLQVPAPLYVISCHVISAKASECPLKINQPTAKFLLFWVILIEAVLNSCRSECPSLGELVVGFCSDGFELKWRIAVGVTISFLLTCISPAFLICAFPKRCTSIKCVAMVINGAFNCYPLVI